MTAKLAGAALIVAGAVWCCAARRRRQRQRLTLAQALAQALSAMETDKPILTDEIGRAHV